MCMCVGQHNENIKIVRIDRLLEKIWFSILWVMTFIAFIMKAFGSRTPFWFWCQEKIYMMNYQYMRPTFLQLNYTTTDLILSRHHIQIIWTLLNYFLIIFINFCLRRSHKIQRDTSTLSLSISRWRACLKNVSNLVQCF